MAWREGVFIWAYNPAGEPDWLEPGEGFALFQDAARQWAPCGPVIQFAGQSDAQPGQADRINVMGWRDFSAPGLRGLTTRRQLEGALLEADVAINARQRQLQNRTLLRKVVYHEFGHALGLVHADDCRALMSFGANCSHIPLDRLPQQANGSDWAQCKQRYGNASPAEMKIENQ
jgi:hypothetical protein